MSLAADVFGEVFRGLYQPALLRVSQAPFDGGLSFRSIDKPGLRNGDDGHGLQEDSAGSRILVEPIVLGFPSDFTPERNAVLESALISATFSKWKSGIKFIGIAYFKDSRKWDICQVGNPTLLLFGA